MISFLVKAVFQYFVVAIAFTTTFLLGYLLLGCTDTKSIYSKVFLARLQLNQSSVFLPNIQSSLNATGMANLTDMAVSIGYLSYCLSSHGSLTCVGYGPSNDTSITGVSIIPTSSGISPQLDLIAIARSFNKVCHPNILTAVIILTIVTMVLLCYSAIPGLPVKPHIHKASCLVTFANLILWGLGSMLQHEAVSSAGNLVSPASMGMLMASRGGRADAMTWTAFTFILVMFLNSVMVLFKDFKQLGEQKGV